MFNIWNNRVSHLVELMLDSKFRASRRTIKLTGRGGLSESVLLHIYVDLYICIFFVFVCTSFPKLYFELIFLLFCWSNGLSWCDFVIYVLLRFLVRRHSLIRKTMCFLDCQSTRDVLTKVARHPPLLQQPRHMPTLAVGLQQTQTQRHKHKHKHKQGTCLFLLLACNRLREKNSPSIQAVHHIHVFSRPEALIITLELPRFFLFTHSQGSRNCGTFSDPELTPNHFLRTRMLRFSRQNAVF